MTEQLYFQDAYLQGCTARIMGVEGQGRESKVLLDRTCLQPNHRDGGDKGVLISAEGMTLPVVRVITDPKHNRIEHLVRSKEPLTVGQGVECRVDWPQRYRLMRKHTGNHLLYGCSKWLLGRSFPALSKTTLGETYTKWLGQAEQVSDTLLAEIFAMAQSIIQEGREVCIETLPRDAALARCGAYYETILPRSAQEIRVVSIEALDADPCIGLHVRNVQEIGGLHFVKVIREGQDLKVYSDIVA
jgi:misacylated tRNA(Ala) deacylase